MPLNLRPSLLKKWRNCRVIIKVIVIIILQIKKILINGTIIYDVSGSLEKDNEL